MPPGRTCGEDSSAITRCDAGLQCKGSTCALLTFLSGATAGCNAEPAKIGHAGCLDGQYSGLYSAAMGAVSVIERLLADAAEVAALSATDKDTFKRAKDIGHSRSPPCLIEAGLLGRGGC